MQIGIFWEPEIFFGRQLLVPAILKTKVAKYLKTGVAKGLSGQEIARKMLRKKRIYEVKMTPVKGFLSGHYNRENKPVNLSREVDSRIGFPVAAVGCFEGSLAAPPARSYGWL